MTLWSLWERIPSLASIRDMMVTANVNGAFNLRTYPPWSSKTATPSQPLPPLDPKPPF